MVAMRLRLIGGVLLTAGLQLVPVSHALVVDRMFVFGDSLSDSGNAAAMTQVAPGVSFFPPSQPSPIPGFGIPYDYRFSNGPVAVEYLAGYLGVPSAPAWPGAPANANPNFAVGGAMTGPAPVLPTIPLPPEALCCNFNWLVNSPAGLQTTPAFLPVKDTGLNNQVSLFASRLAGGAIAPFDPATTLFTVWGGPNDVFLALAYASNPAFGLTPAQQSQVLQAYATNAALNIGARIAELEALNADNFLVLNMPNLGATPLAISQGLIPELTGVSMLFNFVLDGVLDGLRANLGLNIVEFDTFAALNALIASNIFANNTMPCLDTSTPATIQASIPGILAGCQGFLFFDGVHPTTAAHQILAQQLFRAIPEPGPLALLAAAIGLLGWQRRARRR
jgi:phospholipase/lecithinase/hemolysin